MRQWFSAVCGAAGDPGQGRGCMPCDKRLRLRCAFSVGLSGCQQKSLTLVDLCNRALSNGFMGGVGGEGTHVIRNPEFLNLGRNKNQTNP